MYIFNEHCTRVFDEYNTSVIYNEHYAIVIYIELYTREIDNEYYKHIIGKEYYTLCFNYIIFFIWIISIPADFIPYPVGTESD